MNRKTITTILLLLIVCCRWSGGAGENPSVFLSGNKLVYKADSKGNTVPDFSRCGYMGGGVALPRVPVHATLQPLSGEADDTDRIQQAIDTVAKRKPDRNGFRGAVLLERGVYRVAGSLKLKTSGVVLRGEGQGKDGTILLATGRTKRTLISVAGSSQLREVEGSRREISDAYVPFGAMSLTLQSADGYSVGDTIKVFRPGTAQWISAIKMNQIPKRDGRKTTQWRAGGYDFRFERVITAIAKDTITLDAPIVNAMEDRYGGGFVYRTHGEGRVVQVGVEQLLLVSEYEKGQEDTDESHAQTGVGLDHAVNAWVRNVTTVHFVHAIKLGRMAKFVTAQDCAYLKPVSTLNGGRRYSYCVGGEFCLVQRCYSQYARHAEITDSRVCGPNVFLDCLAEDAFSDIGPHQRWAMGILWDNLKGGEFNAQDRANMGSGHGWAGAQQVFWNCETRSICVQQPPTAQNYAIGCLGKISKGSFPGRAPGRYESHGKHVEPRSLYLRQLEDRLGAAAVDNVTTESQRRGAIYSELKDQLYFEL